MSEVIMVLEKPWYNTLTEQMFEQVIEETQPESFIVSSELDNEINKAVLDLLHNPHEGVGTHMILAHLYLMPVNNCM